MVFSSEEDDHLAVVVMLVMVVMPPPPGLAVMIVVMMVLVVVMMIAMGRGRLDRGGQRAGGDEDGNEAGRKGTLQHDDLLDP
jgi:ABC-type xylose transport system permease subunit